MHFFGCGRCFFGGILPCVAFFKGRSGSAPSFSSEIIPKRGGCVPKIQKSFEREVDFSFSVVYTEFNYMLTEKGNEL
jgi:hypothetical protein